MAPGSKAPRRPQFLAGICRDAHGVVVVAVFAKKVWAASAEAAETLAAREALRFVVVGKSDPLKGYRHLSKGR
ncbi:HIT-type domain-containing protein [Psidium guajava]|nr:HIT-type domain-containing protein [Psidium guajava]